MFLCCVSATALTTVLITVTAVNRVGPYFVPSVPVGVAQEHEAPYSRIILNLTRVTRDADPAYDKGPFRYRQSTYKDVFQVDRVTGVVRARVSLDRRRSDQYNVSVYVDNAASPPHTSSLVFLVSASLVFLSGFRCQSGNWHTVVVQVGGCVEGGGGTVPLLTAMLLKCHFPTSHAVWEEYNPLRSPYLTTFWPLMTPIPPRCSVSVSLTAAGVHSSSYLCSSV